MTLKTKTKYKCDDCKQSFLRWASQVKGKTIFCNNTCRGNYRSKNWKPTHPNSFKNLKSNWWGDSNIPNEKKELAKNKMSKFFSEKRIGENHPRWKTDRTLLKKYEGSEERRSPAYKRWRLEVWTRDNFKCRIADNNCDGRLEAHHILAWRDFVELRYKLNNGITLCHAHHPRVRAEEKRLIPTFQELVSVLN